MKKAAKDKDKITTIQLEWEAAGKAGEEKRYVDELYHLYYVLKNIDVNDLKQIKNINCLRELAFKALGLDELAFLVSSDIEIHSYERKHGDEDLMRKIAPHDLLMQYRLEMLYDYQRYYFNAYKLFDLLQTYNKKEEMVFWVEYLLKFDPRNRDVVFNGMTQMVRIGEFQKAIDLGSSIKDDPYIETVKLFCLNRLYLFDIILNTVDSLKVLDIVKQEYKMRALIGLYKNNKKKYEGQLKSQYAEGLKLSTPTHEVNYLASSPYIAKYLNSSQKNIYHYTNIAALKNIIEKNVFWATKNDFLNDNKEHEYIVQLIKEINLSNSQKELLEKALSRYFASINTHFSQEDCGDVLNAFIDKTIRELYMDEIYIVSFSTEPDNLTLWGNYSYFQGYNLGFNKELLIDSMKLNNANEQQDFLIDGKVIYLDEKDKKGFLSSMISEILNDMDTFKVESHIANQIVISHLLLMSNFIKNKSMEAESEYRIISIQLKNDEEASTQREKHVRIKDNSFIPYTVINGKVKESLQCITIGPTNNMDISAKGVKYLLKANGYNPNYPEINKSKITLRY